MFKSFSYKILFVCFFTSVFSIQAQSKKQRELEERRQEIRREIIAINKIRSKEKNEEKSVLTLIEDLNYKLSVRQNLIKITNQQANLLTREINDNQKTISNLRVQLKQLKDDYASLIVKSYKGKNEQSRVMFLLSSSNFQQAYKRLQYIKQYANYQKKKADEIQVKTKELQDLNTDLLRQKQNKQKLIEENRITKRELEKERKEQSEMMASIKVNLNKYASQLKKKQQEANEIDREIDRLIKAAIVASNKKAGKKSSSKTFALTPEAKKLANSFYANKGKLPWPVKEGAVTLSYGEHRHPVVRTTKIVNNGIRIATNKNEIVKAVFQGEVLAIIKPKGAPAILIIQHGNYSTTYKNLSKIFVQKGDKIALNQEIGVVATDTSGESILSFGIFKDSKPTNPSYWLLKR